jgi:hypothetical protein
MHLTHTFEINHVYCLSQLSNAMDSFLYSAVLLCSFTFTLCDSTTVVPANWANGITIIDEITIGVASHHGHGSGRGARGSKIGRRRQFLSAYHELSHWSWLDCARNAVLYSRRDSTGKSSHDSETARIGRTLACDRDQKEVSTVD